MSFLSSGRIGPLSAPDLTDTPQAVQAQVAATRSPYSVSSWLYPGGGDTRGTTPGGKVPLKVGTNYVLYDNATNKVLGQGSTPEAFQSIIDTVNNTLIPQGRGSNWRLYQSSATQPVDDPEHGVYTSTYGKPTYDKASNSWLTPIGGDNPNSVLGDIMSYLGPAALAFAPLGAQALFGGALSGAAGAAGAAGVTSPSVLGAGAIAGLPSAGAITSGLAGLGGTLGAAGGALATGGALAGGTALGGAATGGALGAGTAVGTAAGALAPEIVVTGATGGLGALGTAGAVGAGLGAAGAATGALGGAAPAAANPAEIVVNGKPPVTTVPAGAVAGLPTAAQITAALGAAGTPTAPASTGGMSTSDYINAALKAYGLIGNAVSGAPAGTNVPGGFGQLSSTFTNSTLPAPNMPGLTNPGQRDMAGTDWAHYGEGPERSFFKAVPQQPVALARGGLASAAPRYEDLSPQEREVIDYTRRNMDTGMVQHNRDGSITSFKGAVEDFPDNTIRYFPTFWNGRELPLDAARDRAVRSGIDWPQYPSYDAGLQREGQIHKLMEQEADAYQHRARGGALSHVTGPGGGREDKIPAMLSNDEYVMDAETVALLGNGSPKAGAAALDKLRVNVRKDKGKALVKGKISRDAKAADAYLGGRHG